MERMDTRIASISFQPFEATRNYRTAGYRMPAVPLGAPPVFITCRDLIQRDWGAMIPGTQKRTQHRWLVLGEEIARCLVREWAESGLGMDPYRHPGVWVVRDKVPVTERVPKAVDNKGDLTFEERLVKDDEGQQEFRELTADEQRQTFEQDLFAARAADRAYAEYCWSEGTKISREGKFNYLIPPNYRLAAKQYGLDAEWLREAAAIDSRPCPSCGKLVAKSSFVCMHCQQPTDLERWAAWSAQKEAALRSIEKNNGPILQAAARQAGRPQANT
jgi:hypothetical protein